MAVIEQVRVDPDFEGRGFGRAVVREMRAWAPDYTWTTTVLAAAATGFWAAVGDDQLALGEPTYCAHMRDADARLP